MLGRGPGATGRWTHLASRTRREPTIAQSSTVILMDRTSLVRRASAAGAAALVIALAGVLAAGSQAPPDPAGRARILGSVVRADTGSPVRFAAVQIAATGPVGRWTVTTDENGRFVVEELPAGRYTVTATAPPLLTLGPGQRDPSDPPHVIQLADGETYEHAPSDSLQAA